jgi:hypothetical protein
MRIVCTTPQAAANVLQLLFAAELRPIHDFEISRTRRRPGLQSVQDEELVGEAVAPVRNQVVYCIRKPFLFASSMISYRINKQSADGIVKPSADCLPYKFAKCVRSHDHH